MTTYQCKHGVICGPDGRCERCAKESGDALKAAFGVAPEIGGRSSMRFVAVPGIMSDINSPASVVSSEEGGRATVWESGPDGYNEVERASVVGDASEGEEPCHGCGAPAKLVTGKRRGVWNSREWPDAPEVEFEDTRWECDSCGEAWYTAGQVDRSQLRLLRESLRSTRAALEEARGGMTFYSDELGRVSGLLMRIDPTDRFASCSEHLESLLPRFVREAARSASPVQTPTENGK